MKPLRNRIFDYLRVSLTKDDLLKRVFFFLIGACFAGFGTGALVAFISGSVKAEPLWLLVILGIIVLLFLPWGALQILRCFAHPESRIERVAEKLSPDAVGEDGLIVALVFGLPALLLTLALRSVGVRGRRAAP